MSKVMIAMSGGVDSSYAALKLLDEGYEVLGATLKLYCEDESNDAKKVADKLGFVHETIDMKQHFCDTVISDFVSSYRKGETPNPCIVCNKYVKFGKLLDYALDKGCKYFATGHYARVEKGENGRFLLRKAADLSKDQTYVLYHLTQKQLSHLILPLGEETKSNLRQKAEKVGLINANKPDSQDICFIPDGNYTSFLQEYTKESFTEGDMVDTNGNFIAKHSGIEKYTIGQRKGLGVSFGKVKFVVAKNAESKQVVIGDAEDLMKSELIAKDVNFIQLEKLEEPMRVTAKTRYSQKEQPATISMEGEKVKVVFDEPQRAITPGQAVVFYDGEYVVGGGTIE